MVTTAVALATITGCSAGDVDDAATAEDTTDAAAAATSDALTDDRFPTILGADVTYDDGSETWSFAVTVSSPYDTPERYADGWRVVGPDGTVFGVHTLAHDHAAEQPFTRRQSGVSIPDDVDEVTIEGRDLANGFGGTSLTVRLERNSR